MKKLLNILKFTVEVVLVLGFIFIEELVWDKFVRPIRDWFVKQEISKMVEAKVQSQSVYTILAIFVALFIVVELLGFWAGALILTGSVITGIIIYGLKIPLAAFTFWMFGFTKDKLLTIEWFASVYKLIVQLFDWIKTTRIYRRVKVQIYLTKKYLKTMSAGGVKEDMIKIYNNLKEIFKKESTKEVKEA